jgi:nucleoid-associated protein YgaU
MMQTSNSAGYIRMALMGTAFIALTIVLIVFQPGSPRNAQSTFEPEPSSTVTRVADPLTPPPAPEVTPVVAPTPVQVPTPMPQLATTDQATYQPTNLRDMTFSAISNLKSVTTGEAPAPGQPGSLLHSVVQRSIANSTAAPTTAPQVTAPQVTEIRPVSAPRLPSTGAYFVRPGDTLLSIAKEVYGDTTMSSEIFRHNTNILTSPDSLKPGMVLKLPTP